MKKFNVGDLVCFGDRRHSFPYTVIHIHQAPNDSRVWYVCAYKGDIPYIKTADELFLHTAAKGPVEEGDGRVGTLKELGVKPGDVVELVYNGIIREVCEGETSVITKEFTYPGRGDNNGHRFRIISRAKADKYGPWQLATPTTPTTDDMQVSRGPDGEIVAYRVKVEPKVKPHTLYGEKYVWNSVPCPVDTHKITFNTVDGEPDCASIKMEKL